MSSGITPWDISVEFLNILLAMGLGALAVFLAAVYIEEVAASLRPWMRLLAPCGQAARRRLGLLLHRTTP